MKRSAACFTYVFMLSFFCTTVYAATVDVSMVNFKFQPDPVTVNVGDTIKWTNNSTVHHTSTSGSSCTPDGIWASPNLTAGESFSFVFTTAGTFPYYCIPHCTIGMTGTVIVNQGSTTTMPGTTTTTAVSTTTSVPVTTTIPAGTTTTTTASSCPLGLYINDQTDIHMLRQVRNALLRTPYGVLLAALYYQNAPEINSILAGNEHLQSEMIKLIDENRACIYEFAARGRVVILRKEEFALVGFLNSLADEGSMQLRSDIEMVISVIDSGQLWKAVQTPF